MVVDISDENNNPPEFPNSSMRFPASESLAVGATVATVKATDRDTDDVLTYSLSLKNGDLGADFVIDSATATISVGPSGLDRERKSEYQLEGRLMSFLSDIIIAQYASFHKKQTVKNDLPIIVYGVLGAGNTSHASLVL